MDLALALGRDVGSMPVRELSRWKIYHRRKGFPSRRLEYYFALICSMLSAALAAQGITELPPIDDYLFDPQRDDDGQLIDPPEVDHAQAAREAFGYNPRK